MHCGYVPLRHLGNIVMRIETTTTDLLSICFLQTDKSWTDYRALTKTGLSANIYGPCTISLPVYKICWRVTRCVSSGVIIQVLYDELAFLLHLLVPEILKCASKKSFKYASLEIKVARSPYSKITKMYDSGDS